MKEPHLRFLTISFKDFGAVRRIYGSDIDLKKIFYRTVYSYPSIYMSVYIN
jgi:hypothetical protein